MIFSSGWVSSYIDCVSELIAHLSRKRDNEIQNFGCVWSKQMPLTDQNMNMKMNFRQEELANTMVIILIDGISEHIAHLSRKRDTEI